MPLPRDLRALLIDLDDTLIERSGALRAWLRRRAGLSPSELDMLLRLDADEAGELVLVAIELLRMRPGLALDASALGQRIRDELPAELRPDPAIAGALGRAREAGLRLAVVSNGGATTQRRKLAQARLGERFDVVVISGEVGCAKPEPAIFRLALERLGVGAEAAVMIGDSVTHDMVGAAALGMRTAWVSRGRAWPEGLQRPTWAGESLLGVIARLMT